MRKSRLAIYALTLLLAAALLWYGARLDEESVLHPVDASPLVVDTDCDPRREACTAEGEGMRLTLRLIEEVPVLAPFPVRVTVAPVAAARAVSVDFTMPGMDMGLNRYRLRDAGNGQWEGTATLPVCTTGRTDWLATVTVQGEAGAWRAAFAFVTER